MISIPWTARIALRALKVNKMRSALTMLGIIIGVGAVIAMLAVGTGASRRIAEQMATMGSNLLIILPGSQTSGGVRKVSGSQTTLTLGDQKPSRESAGQYRMWRRSTMEPPRLSTGI